MEALATSFTLTTLHSLWQTGLLFLAYWLINVVSVVNPRSKRNMLLGILLTQLSLSVVTFILLSAKIPNRWLNFFSVPNNIDTILLDHISLYLVAAYLLMVSYKITFYFFEYKRFVHFQGQKFLKPHAEIRVFTQLKAEELGVKKVQIWFSEHIHTPFTYGFLKPCILLPVALVNQLSMTETEALIVHELTHIKNKDYLFNYGLLFMETLFCFNPFIFFITRKIKLEREKSCDLQVLQYKYSPLLYAETLFKTALHHRDNFAWQIAAISGKHQLLNRIRFFTHENDLSKMKKTFNPINYALLLFVAFMSILVITDDKNTITHKYPNRVTFLMPSYSYHFPVIEETNPVISTSAVAAILPEKKVKPVAILKNATIETPVELSEPINAMQVSASEPVSKQIVIREQDPASGKISTYVFKSTFINGEWTAEPIITVIENKTDTCDKSTGREIKEFNAEQ